jgi:hypothetical protein
MVSFAAVNNVTVVLACLPPYHSKFNPAGHVWGSMEGSWSGVILNSHESILGYAEMAVFNGMPVKAHEAEGFYPLGVTLPKNVMEIPSKALGKAEGLEKWFAVIAPDAARERWRRPRRSSWSTGPRRRQGRRKRRPRRSPRRNRGKAWAQSATLFWYDNVRSISSSRPKRIWP